MTKSSILGISSGWLDSLGASISVICAVHCLLTPILIIFLPIFNLTFWTHHNFHLWMVLLILPITTTAFFLGCRKHKDKWVLILGIIGITCLISVALYEAFENLNIASDSHHCCSKHANRESLNRLKRSTIVNVIGGIFVATAHIRNYFLCRKQLCSCSK